MRSEPVDAVDLGLGELESMLVLIGGEGLENFQCMNDALQSFYLSALSTKVGELRAQFDKVTEERSEILRKLDAVAKAPASKNAR